MEVGCVEQTVVNLSMEVGCFGQEGWVFRWK